MCRGSLGQNCRHAPPSTTLRPTVAWQRMPLVDEIVPVRDLKLAVRGDFREAMLQPSGLRLPVSHAGGWTQVVVPRVDIHEMVVLRRG